MKKRVWINRGDVTIGYDFDPLVDPLVDDELLTPWDGPFRGYSVFAWKPTRCRNGKVRWLCWLERQHDGTFTKDRSGW